MWGGAVQYAPLPQAELELQPQPQPQYQPNAPTNYYAPSAQHVQAQPKKSWCCCCCRNCCVRTCCCGCCCGTVTFFLWSFVLIVLLGISVQMFGDYTQSRFLQCINPDSSIEYARQFSSWGVKNVQIECSTVPCIVDVVQNPDRNSRDIKVMYSYHYQSQHYNQSQKRITPNGFHAEWVEPFPGGSILGKFYHDNYDISSCEQFRMNIVLPQQIASSLTLGFDINLGAINITTISLNRLQANVQIGAICASNVTAYTQMTAQIKTIGFLDVENLNSPRLTADGNVVIFLISNATQSQINTHANAGFFGFTSPLEQKLNFDLKTSIGSSQVAGFPDQAIQFSDNISLAKASGVINPQAMGQPQQISAEITNGWTRIHGAPVCDGKFCDQS